jgi:hypothetical protein
MTREIEIALDRKLDKRGKFLAGTQQKAAPGIESLKKVLPSIYRLIFTVNCLTRSTQPLPNRT